MAMYVAAGSKPRPGGVEETIRLMQKAKPIWERHGAVVTAARATSAGAMTGEFLIALHYESLTALGAALHTATRDPEWIACSAEIQSSTAAEMHGTVILRDLPGYEGPIPSLGPNGAMTVVAYERRPEQQAALADLCAGHR
jgi:hypothetical protein